MQMKEAGDAGLALWDSFCEDPVRIITKPLPEQDAFRLLVASFQLVENRQSPTFSAINAMANFLHRHIAGMLQRCAFLFSFFFLTFS